MRKIEFFFDEKKNIHTNQRPPAATVNHDRIADALVEAAIVPLKPE